LILTFLVGQYTALFGSTGLGLAALVWVFFVSMVLSQQSAFSLNTAMHGVKPSWFNTRRYPTPDSTTNMWLLAIPTLGAAWHNNHHRYMTSARAGFYWYELDLGYLILRLLALLHIVWDLNPVPEDVIAEGRGGPVAAG
jgi:stearoyl-CoA desaturase (delta-9 desaturase)